MGGMTQTRRETVTLRMGLKMHGKERLGLGVFFCLLFFWTLSPLAGFDFWFYLAVGKDIVDHRAVPWSESYLGTTAVYAFGRYADQAWLGNLVCYLVYLGFGALGLTLFKSGLLVATTAITYLNCRLVGLSAFWAGCWSALSLWTIRGRFEMRTYLLSDLALSALIFLMIRLEQGADRKRSALGIVLLFAVWTNLHQGIIAGMAVGGLWLIFGRVDVKTRLSIAGAALAATMIRPHPLEFPAFLYDHFANAQAITGVIEWGPPPMEVLIYQLGPFLLLAVGLTSMGILKRRTQHVPQPPWAYLFIGLFFLLLSLRSMRSISELLPVVCPLVAAYFPKLPKNGRVQGVFAAILLLLLGTSFSTDQLRGLNSTQGYPARLLEILEDSKTSGQLFNSFEFGNYLVYRGIPPFIHGMTAFYEEQLITDFQDTLNPTPRRSKVLEKFQVDSVLLHFPTEIDATLSLVDSLYDSPDWKFLAWDDTGLLFVRGDARDGYQNVQPWRNPPWTDPSAAQTELRQVVETSPSALAHLLLSQLLLESGQLSPAIQHANLSVELSPTFYPAWAQLGKAYARAKNLDGLLLASAGGLQAAPDSAPAHFNRALAELSKSGQENGLPASWSRFKASIHLRRALWFDPRFAPARRALDSL